MSELLVGTGIVLKRHMVTNQKVEPTTAEDPQGIWPNRQLLIISTDGSGAKLYMQDPAAGAEGLQLGANMILKLAYTGPLWVTATGDLYIAVFG